MKRGGAAVTSETRTMIEFADVVAVEFKCTKCSTSITKPIQGDLCIPVLCPNCRNTFFIENSTAHKHLELAIVTMRNVANEQSSPCQMRLEIKSHSTE
jgi:DNA-directed RNA polymerase subunit RPC12/RpoP